MASPGTRGTLRLPLYSVTPSGRLRRAQRPTLAFVLACALANGGCALSFPLESMFSKKQGTTGEVTGSTEHGPMASAFESDQFEADLVYARTVAAELLARGGKDASAPWENPATGARGNITPVAAAYLQDGATCRDFLASYVRGEATAWLAGEACRGVGGRWEVKSLKAFKRTT
jgi:surface antigen